MGNENYLRGGGGRDSVCKISLEKVINCGWQVVAKLGFVFESQSFFARNTKFLLRSSVWNQRNYLIFISNGQAYGPPPKDVVICNKIVYVLRVEI